MKKLNELEIEYRVLSEVREKMKASSTQQVALYCDSKMEQILSDIKNHNFQEAKRWPISVGQKVLIRSFSGLQMKAKQKVGTFVRVCMKDHRISPLKYGFLVEELCASGRIRLRGINWQFHYDDLKPISAAREAVLDYSN